MKRLLCVCFALVMVSIFFINTAQADFPDWKKEKIDHPNWSVAYSYNKGNCVIGVKKNNTGLWIRATITNPSDGKMNMHVIDIQGDVDGIFQKISEDFLESNGKHGLYEMKNPHDIFLEHCLNAVRKSKIIPKKISTIIFQIW